MSQDQVAALRVDLPRVGAVRGAPFARALLGWLLASVIVAGSTFAVGALAMPASDGTTKALTAITVFEVYALLIASLYLGLGRAKGLRELLGVRVTSGRDIVLGMVVGTLCWVGAALGYLALGQLGALTDALAWLGTDGGRLGTIDPVATGLSLLRACILAPIGEELLFRGALFGWLRGHTGAWPTIFITALLFAAVHILPVLMPFAFVLGVGLGWVRERTGSTVPGIVFHIAHNTTLFMIVFVLMGWQ